MTKSKSTQPLPPSSCKECQRRKQKCSKEWPCQPCLSRKVPHLCQFGEKKNVSNLTDEGIRAAVSRKRSNADTESESNPSSDTLVQEHTGLVSWGYMSENKLFEMEAVVHGDGPTTPLDAPFLQADALENVLKNIPTRTITDALVQNYLYSANFRYYWIYPPTFTKGYSDWWAGRQTHQALSPDFTCLLLRLCAVSTQHLSDELQKKIEYEFAEDYEKIGRRYFEAADKLNATLMPATCTIQRAQQLMLKASWYKAEGQPLETWHAVGEGVRAAQELGMHNGIDAQNLDEFESEMRKRLWCTLYIWDWQMSAWLNRPLIIDHATCKLELPTLKLEQRPDYPGLPSPFTHMARQAALIQTLSERLRNFGDTPPLQRVHILQADIQQWMDDLPSAYSMVNAEKRYDAEFPYLIIQRLQLHACAWMLKMDSFKSFLTRDLPQDAAPIEREFRAKGIECALNLYQSTSKLYAFEHPIGTKFHLVAFLFFDVALLFSSAILHDKEFSLPRRPEVLLALEDLLDKFYLIGETTQSGKNAYKFLSRLVSRLKLKPGERIHSGNILSKRVRKNDEFASLTSPQSDDSPAYLTEPSSTRTLSRDASAGSGMSEIDLSPATQAVPAQPPTLADPISDFEKHFQPMPIPTAQPEQSHSTALAGPTFDLTSSTITNIDIGGIEQIIGWDNYHFDLNALGTSPNWLYDPNAFPQFDPFSDAQFDPLSYPPSNTQGMQ